MPLPIILEELSRSLKDRTHSVSLFTRFEKNRLFGIVVVDLLATPDEHALLDEEYCPAEDRAWQLTLGRDLRTAKVAESMVVLTMLALIGMLQHDQELLNFMAQTNE